MLYPQPAVEPACTQHTPRQGVYRHTQLCGTCVTCDGRVASIEQCNVLKSVMCSAVLQPGVWGQLGRLAQAQRGACDVRMGITTEMAAHDHIPASIQLQLQQPTLCDNMSRKTSRQPTLLAAQVLTPGCTAVKQNPLSRAPHGSHQSFSADPIRTPHRKMLRQCYKGDLLCSAATLHRHKCAHQLCAAVVMLQQQCQFPTCTCATSAKSTERRSCKTSLQPPSAKRPEPICTLSRAVRKTKIQRFTALRDTM